MAAGLAEKPVVLSINLNETLSTDVKLENISCHEVVTLLPVLIRRTVNDPTKVIASSEQANLHGGFRKIEPKPVGEGDAGVSSFDITKERRKKRKGDTSIRFLGSNATQRGVRICVTCQGRIGYRSKKCKYCLSNEKSKPMGNLIDTSSKGTMNTNVLQRKVIENTESMPSVVEAIEGKENTLVQENENVLHRHLSADHNYVQIGYSKNEVLFPLPVFCTPETVLNTTNKIVDTSAEDKVKGTGQDEISLCCDGTTTADQSGSLEGKNDDQEQTSLQDEDFDKGGIPSEDLPQILKQEIIEDNLCDLNPCSVSKNTLISHMFLEDKCIGDISLAGPEGVEKRAGEFVQAGRKRKQKVYPSGKKKQCKDYPVIQFMRIEPKPCLELDKACPKNLDQGNVPESKLNGKQEPVRFLASNATRRGIMPCPMCQKEVGCRSKSCKHCTVSITLNKYKALNDRNLLLVELSPETTPGCAVFSMKKTTTPSEERCFIKQAPVTTPTKADHKVTVESSTPAPSMWSCECQENDEFSQIPICEHAMCFFRSPKIVQARTIALAAQKIDNLPIDGLFKNKLKQLWEKNKRRELPLVQQVGLNTLVVLDIEKDTGNCSDGGTCVHIRFEKLKRQSVVQHHIFCSGKSCSVWSSLENQNDSPITCLHYCISLWAIASDNELQEYFKIFLEAPQVFLHSEVFESIASS